MHPIDDAGRGEYLIKAVYEAVRNSPLWEASAIIVLFDEHGDSLTTCVRLRRSRRVISNEQNQHGFCFTNTGSAYRQ